MAAARKAPTDCRHAMLFTVPPGNPAFPRNLDPALRVVLCNQFGDAIVSRIGR